MHARIEKWHFAALICVSSAMCEIINSSPLFIGPLYFFSFELPILSLFSFFKLNFFFQLLYDGS